MLKLMLKAALIGALLAVQIAAADERPTAANSAIMGAYFDLDRYEARLRGLKPGRTASLRSLMRGVEMTSARLQSAPNQDDVSWKYASERLARVEQELAKLSAGAAPATSPASSGPAGRQERRQGALLARLQALETDMQAVQPGDTGQCRFMQHRLNGLIRDYRSLGERKPATAADIEQRFSALEDRIDRISRAAPKQEMAHYEALPPLLSPQQRVGLQQVSANVALLSDEVQALQPEALQQPQVQAEWQDRMQQAQSELAGFGPGVLNPDVEAVQRKLEQAWLMLERKQTQAFGMGPPARP